MGDLISWAQLEREVAVMVDAQSTLSDRMHEAERLSHKYVASGLTPAGWAVTALACAATTVAITALYRRVAAS
ncbi:hypothetical protein PQU92_00775 [Asticcacaulis sp. BYS171W]|uniref:DUF3618 domain-containing protein n=1 Tax=Asticcacaulis aquaticus TaxID=2984212 RepID=A0ABT5HP14_9CAUL|nr:hypothetical protein [Asticcacaulis aquaticus]MDC7681791.1 hypothetical protein [Asticcacaulis aquaticus]